MISFSITLATNNLNSEKKLLRAGSSTAARHSHIMKENTKAVITSNMAGMEMLKYGARLDAS